MQENKGETAQERGTARNSGTGILCGNYSQHLSPNTCGFSILQHPRVKNVTRVKKIVKSSNFFVANA